MAVTDEQIQEYLAANPNITSVGSTGSVGTVAIVITP